MKIYWFLESFSVKYNHMQQWSQTKVTERAWFVLKLTDAKCGTFVVLKKKSHHDLQFKLCLCFSNSNVLKNAVTCQAAFRDANCHLIGCFYTLLRNLIIKDMNHFMRSLTPAVCAQRWGLQRFEKFCLWVYISLSVFEPFHIHVWLQTNPAVVPCWVWPHIPPPASSCLVWAPPLAPSKNPPVTNQ